MTEMTFRALEHVFIIAAWMRSCYTFDNGQFVRKGASTVLDHQEVEACEAALRSLSPEYDWLLDSNDTTIGVSVILENHRTSLPTVRKWVDAHRIPGAYADPDTGVLRIPRIGLIVFFGRLVMPSFRATA
jgi:hypothetical protein